MTYLIETDVLIDYLRNMEGAANYLDSNGGRFRCSFATAEDENVEHFPDLSTNFRWTAFLGHGLADFGWRPTLSQSAQCRFNS